MITMYAVMTKSNLAGVQQLDMIHLITGEFELAHISMAELERDGFDNIRAYAVVSESPSTVELAIAGLRYCEDHALPIRTDNIGAHTGAVIYRIAPEV